MKERIDKIIASQTQFTRSEVKKLIKKTAVKINGIPVRSPEEKADPGTDEITVAGEKIEFKKYLYIMLNKPKGVVSATEDREKTTVLDLLPEQLRRDGLFPAGRLDGDTTGFVLITDDGDTAHRMLSPKNHVEKVYHAVLAEPLTQQTVDLFKEGVVLSDGSVCMSASVRLLADGEQPTVEVALRQGMYHQIKRMFAACGNRVVKLHRVKIGGVFLDEELNEGECRLLTKEEIGRLTVTYEGKDR